MVVEEDIVLPARVTEALNVCKPRSSVSEKVVVGMLVKLSDGFCVTKGGIEIVGTYDELELGFSLSECDMLLLGVNMRVVVIKPLSVEDVDALGVPDEDAVEFSDGVVLPDSESDVILVTLGNFEELWLEVPFVRVFVSDNVQGVDLLFFVLLTVTESEDEAVMANVPFVTVLGNEFS